MVPVAGSAGRVPGKRAERCDTTKCTAGRPSFLKAQIVFWLLAAPDGHAKNFSLFHERGGRYPLTPFYDVLSAWPSGGRSAGKIPRQKLKMAMAVEGKNRHYN